MRYLIRRLMLTGALALPIVLMTGILLAAPKYTTLCWEGEDARELSGKVLKVFKYTDDPSGKVSNKKVIGVPKLPQGQHPARDDAKYSVRIPKTDIYYLWVRCYWSTGCGNSFYLKIEDVPGEQILGGDATYDCLHWVCLTDGGKNDAKPRPLMLKKGVVTFTLTAKESAARVDQFLLTTDAKMTPANIYKVTPNVLSPDGK